MNQCNSYGCVSSKQASLKENMRFVWLQHVYWTRMLLISIAEHLKDQPDVTARLLQNPHEIANVFAKYYSAEAAEEIENLLTEHLQIGAELITALRDNQKEKAAELDKRWYINADSMAAAFSSINPHYDYNTMRDMLFTHLDLTKTEVAKRLAGQYSEDITAFGAVEKEALSMADSFTEGIVKQFWCRFN
jgi:hypothetical protein